MDGCQFQKKRFTVCLNQSKKYDENYSKIDWGNFNFKKCPNCETILSLLGLKDKETNLDQYLCSKCNKRWLLNKENKLIAYETIGRREIL